MNRPSRGTRYLTGSVPRHCAIAARMACICAGDNGCHGSMARVSGGKVGLYQAAIAGHCQQQANETERSPMGPVAVPGPAQQDGGVKSRFSANSSSSATTARSARRTAVALSLTLSHRRQRGPSARACAGSRCRLGGVRYMLVPVLSVSGTHAGTAMKSGPQKTKPRKTAIFRGSAAIAGGDGGIRSSLVFMRVFEQLHLPNASPQCSTRTTNLRAPS